MFVWNMIGALVLIPALSYFLLPTSVVQKTDLRLAVRVQESRV
jgi:hypothetical protein